jgi:hypothetical protein
MFGLGWVRSWWVVPAVNQFGGDAISGWMGFIWALSVPLGAFIVAMGAALVAKVERRVFWLLIQLLSLRMACQQLLRRHLGVIVADPMRHPADEVEGLHVPFEESLLLLRREGHHEQLPGVAQP